MSIGMIEFHPQDSIRGKGRTGERYSTEKLENNQPVRRFRMYNILVNLICGKQANPTTGKSNL
jgi:hypothetical protein